MDSKPLGLPLKLNSQLPLHMIFARVAYPPPNKRVHAVGRSVHAGCIEPAARTDWNTIEWRPLAAGRNRRAPARPGGRARVRR